VTGPRLRLPHPLILLLGCLVIAALLSHVLPAGRYQRRGDPVTGRSVVVPGTYARVPAHPLGPFQTLVALPKGLVDAGSVVFLVFLVGGAFSVVEQTGALGRAVGWLAQRLDRREALVIPIVSLAFAVGGITENMQEEIIAFVPRPSSPSPFWCLSRTSWASRDRSSCSPTTTAPACARS